MGQLCLINPRRLVGRINKDSYVSKQFPVISNPEKIFSETKIAIKDFAMSRTFAIQKLFDALTGNTSQQTTQSLSNSIMIRIW